MHRISSLTCLALGLSACQRPELSTDRVQDLGALETSSTIKGRDGGYSGVWRGRSIWLYGDTILSLAGVDGSSWRHNSWSYTGDLDASDGIIGFAERTDDLGAPMAFFPETDDEAAFNRAHSGDGCENPCGARRVLWPGPLVTDAARDRALVFYGKIYGEPGEWNFHGLGSGIALWTDFASYPARPELDLIDGEPTLLFDQDEPSFGTAALALGEMLYAYACDGGLAKHCKIGRVPLEHPLDRSAWEFYDGSGWTDDLSHANPVLDGGAMMSVHWNAYLSGYLAVYSKPLDERIGARLAPSPEGPWSDEVVLLEAMPGDGGDAPYGGLAHAEYAQEDGHIELVTYFRSTGDWTGELRAVEVTVEPEDFGR